MATIIKRNSTTTTNTIASPLLRSVGYSLRGVRTVSDVVRQTINITIDEYGRVTNSNFSLGNRGDNLVTCLDFNIASVIQVEKLADYNVTLFIYNPRLGKSNLNPIRVEPQAGYTPDLVRFILESNWFSSAGTYELIFGLIEDAPKDGNVDQNLEVFLSDVMKASLIDTGIHGDFVEQLIPGALPVDAENNFDEFIQKPHLTAQLENNTLKIVGTSNVNQWDAYTTYIQLEGFSPLLQYFYLIYNMPSVDNTAYGSVRFIEESGESGTTYKTWLPKSWTTIETKVRAWIVGTDLEINQSMIDDGSWRKAKVYVTNSFDFQTKTNFLDKENWETTLLESGALKLLDKEENDILVIPENTGGTYQLSYTGSEVDDLLSYVNQLKNGGGGDLDALPVLQLRVNQVESQIVGIINGSTGTSYEIQDSVSTIEDLPAVDDMVNDGYYYVEDTNAIYQADRDNGVYRLVECAIKIINGGGAI